MPSPVDWATYPPQRCTASIISLSAGSTMARASSGSRSSISSIEPLMSANSAVTVLRSPSNDAPSSESLNVGGLDVSSRCAGGPDGSAVVHCPQNLKPGGFSKLHFGQTSTRAVVHCPQNLIPAGFSNPHFEQRTEVPGPLSRKTVQTKPL